MVEARGLGGALARLGGHPDELLAAWLDRFQESMLRLPGRVDRETRAAALRPCVDSLLEALATRGADGVLVPAPLRPGDPGLRELEKELAFLGGHLAADGTSAFDVAALVFALRDAVLAAAADAAEREATEGLFEWFTALALEGHATARGGAEREKQRELLEDRSPVVCVVPDLPMAFLLGDERVHGVDAVLARLVLSVVRVGARAVVVDAGGLTDAGGTGVVDALHRFCSHTRIRGQVALIATGLNQAQVRAWRGVARAADLTFEFAETHAQALECAMVWSDYEMVRKPSSAAP